MRTYRRKVIDSIFDEAIESDFNPDIIQLCIIDAFDEGHKRGMLIGGLLTACAITYVLVKNGKKNEIKES